MITFDIAMDDRHRVQAVTEFFNPLANLLEKTSLVVAYKAYHDGVQYPSTYYAGFTKLCDRWPWESVSHRQKPRSRGPRRSAAAARDGVAILGVLEDVGGT